MSLDSEALWPIIDDAADMTGSIYADSLRITAFETLCAIQRRFPHLFTYFHLL
jgi:hypothetical protein